MWPETKGIQYHMQYMFILQLLDKEGLHHWESFALAAPNNNENEQPDNTWEAFEGSSRQTTSFRSYREYNLNSFYQQEMSPLLICNTRLTVLLDKCNYN